MSWYISIDKIDNDDAVGQWNGKEDTLVKCMAVCKYSFRMLDDDGEVYYHGKSDDDSSFDPLDDFGTPNAGCTEIQYFNKKTRKWETL